MCLPCQSPSSIPGSDMGSDRGLKLLASGWDIIVRLFSCACHRPHLSMLAGSDSLPRLCQQPSWFSRARHKIPTFLTFS